MKYFLDFQFYPKSLESCFIIFLFSGYGSNKLLSSLLKNYAINLVASLFLPSFWRARVKQSCNAFPEKKRENTENPENYLWE